LSLPFITGRNSVLEALKGRRKIYRLFVLKNQAEKPQLKEIIGLASTKKVRVVWLEKEAETLKHLKLKQGVAAEVEEFSYTDFDRFLEEVTKKPTSFVVVVDNLEDPQNFGNLLRTAEFFGADGVIIRKKRSVQVTPVVERISQGATNHLKIARVANLSRAIESLKNADFFVAGLDAAATEVLKPETLAPKTVLVVGGEDRGLSRLVKEKCDNLFRIEGYGKLTSLNAASAFAAAAYCYVLRMKS
jgi:23S rRNA (guanosine2251-2'-O)-methyltransferase